MNDVMLGLVKNNFSFVNSNSGTAGITNLHFTPLAPIRKEFNGHNVNITWQSYSDAVKAGGHTFCGLARDLYLCDGNVYINRLKHTPHFREEFSLGQVKHGTQIFFEGNSHLYEHVLSWLCESHKYIINANTGQKSNDTLIIHTETAERSKGGRWSRHTGMLVHLGSGSGSGSGGSDVRIFVLTNENYYNYHTLETISLLRDVGFSPDVIVLGPLNYFPARFATNTNTDTATATAATEGLERRRVLYASNFKHTRIVTPDTSLNRGCFSNFKNCDDKTAVEWHECIPGPILQQTEKMAMKIINASWSQLPI